MVDNMPFDIDSQAACDDSHVPQKVAVGNKSKSARRRGPQPSPAKSRRDASRADAHRALSFPHQICANATCTFTEGPANSGDLVAEVEEIDFEVLTPEPLEPIAEGRSNQSRCVDMKKRAEKDRLRRQHAEEEAASAVSSSTVTVHAPGDALKAEALSLEVGTSKLLEDAKLIISEQTGIHGLVGPNGCGKTTLLRLIAGKYAPDCQLPLPRAWGSPYLVDQLDPEPTGRSPVEEVLSGCEKRTALLEEQQLLIDKMSMLDEQLMQGRELSNEDHSYLEKLTEQISEVDEQLVQWDSAEKDVTRILVGLGFHDGNKSADGAPSLRVKDELITGAASLKLKGSVEVRDNTDEEWARGIVTSLDPLMVQPDGFAESFTWTEVRHSRELSGGWRKKVNLAKALWMKPKLLLLDEPTNHLDFHALLWLEEELKAYPHTVVIVSHNSCFLSDVCNKVLHIANRGIQTISMAELSLDTLAAMQRSNETHRKFRDWRFAFPSGDQPEMHGLSFHNVSFSYSPEAPLVLKDLHRDVARFNGRSRSVILGRNGSGKSTLLKLCLGILQPTHGEVDVSCEMRHFSQHFNEALENYPDHVATSYLVECCRPGLQKRFKHTGEERLLEDACEVLSWFGLGRREATNTPIKHLSGGQKARLNFAFLNLCPAHLLILDEPTNHLDANGLEHLADALHRFEGGVVLVSHDELLVRRLLQSAEHSELLICQGGVVHKQSGVQGLDSYRRAAFREQHLKAETAAIAAEQRLQSSRQERRVRPRQKRASISAASTREPTPDKVPVQPHPTQQSKSKEHVTLDAFCKKKGKKKPQPMNFNAPKS